MPLHFCLHLHAQLMDGHTHTDFLQHLLQELASVQAVAASAQGHSAALLGGVPSAAAGGIAASAASADQTKRDSGRDTLGNASAGGSVAGSRTTDQTKANRAHLPWAQKYAPLSSSQVRFR